MQRALRTLFKKGNHNFIKILSLGAGLAIGLVLIAKVCFETSYDNFYPDANRIYKVKMNSVQNDVSNEYGQVPGGVTPGMQAEVPGVEVGTRITWLWDNGIFRTQDKKKYKGELVVADTNFFRLFPRKILAGDVNVLAQPRYLMISDQMAQAMGGPAEAMGKILFSDELPNVPLTVGGVFERVPENTELQYDLLLSIESIQQWSRENWLGNERYVGFVLLGENVVADSLAKPMRQMQYNHQDLDDLNKKGLDIWYTLHPFDKEHTDAPEVKRMNVLLSLLAFALIFTAVMNYVLIVISSLVNRTKEVGVRKCYGAEGRHIRAIILSETVVHLFFSLVVAVAIILACKGTIENLLDASLGALFTPRTYAVMVGVVVGVFVASGLIPAIMFEHIPVSSAFHHYKESRRKWKLGLLFFQFAASAFLVVLLVIIGRQYNTMVNDNPGYAYSNLLFCNLNGADSLRTYQAMEEAQRLPIVKDVALCLNVPLESGSGNNIRLPGEDRDLFNICDLYYCSANYMDLMEIKMIEGHAPSTLNEVAVSRKFLTEMARFTDWKDGALGQPIFISEHSQPGLPPFTICGVFEDILVGNRTGDEARAQVIFFHDDIHAMHTVVIKLHELHEGDVATISEIFEKALPEKDVQMRPYRDEIRHSYEASLKFKNSVMIGGIITLLISLIGLIGYTNDETNRRRKEIAIRKINGGTLGNILALFLKDTLWLSLPAFVGGCIGAYFVASQWLEQFTLKIALSWDLFVVPAICLLLLVLAVVALNCLRIARANPVDSLVAE